MILENTKALEFRPSGKRRETYVDVMCDECGQIRRVTMSTAKRAACCIECQRVSAVLAMTSNALKRLRGIAKYQTEHPSSAEAQVKMWLDEMAIPYRQQVIFIGDRRAYILDFVVGVNVPSMITAEMNYTLIEVNGYHHIRPEIMKRDDDLCRDFDGKVIFIDASNMEGGKSGLSRILGK